MDFSTLCNTKQSDELHSSEIWAYIALKVPYSLRYITLKLMGCDTVKF